MREYSFGRRRRIDLVLKMEQIDGGEIYLVIECKTDSDVSIEQLKQSEREFSKQVKNAQVAVISLAVGAGQFTINHVAKELQECGFRAIDLDHALDVFSELSIAGDNCIYDEWITSMEAEQNRLSDVCTALQTQDHPWDDRLRKSGYRLGFPLFYMYYGKLREHLESCCHQNWAIYSGRNNPVLNWQNGWIAGDGGIEMYWEFNWDAFCLKAALKNEGIVARWAQVRPVVIEMCSTCSVEGQRTPNRRGTWVTAYKWKFDFCKETPVAIAEESAGILSELHERLQTIA